MTTIQEISAKELKAILNSRQSVQVVDVREPVEFDAECVKEARCMPLSSFEEHACHLEKDKPVYLLCRTGNRARQAAEKLGKLGVREFYSVTGGLEAWKAAGFETRQSSPAVWGLERQVRFAAGALVVTGVVLGWLMHSTFAVVAAVVGVGLMFSAITDTCGIAMLLARMPWNRPRQKRG